MRFTVTELSACPGGNHITMTIQMIPSGRTRTETFSKKEALSIAEDREIEADKRDRILSRIVSHIRESGLTAPVQIRNDLLAVEEFNI